MKQMIELGDRVKDEVTGFTGIAVCISKWLHGCKRITIQPTQLKDGKPIDNSTFDEPQITVLKKSVHGTTLATGGPRPEPVQHITPR